MDIIKQFSSIKTKHLKEMVIKFGDPNEEQLGKYINTLSNQLLFQIVVNLSDVYKEIAYKGLKKMNWDYSKNKKVKNSNLSVDLVLEGLEILITELNSIKMSKQPTPEELASVKEATKRLWDLDVNRLVPGRDYIINLQNGKRVYDQRDMADEKLFTYLDLKIFNKKTFRCFYNLLDNYICETGVAEVVGKEEKKENMDFISAILETPVMKYCHNYLVAIKKASPNLKKFHSQLMELWFGLYVSYIYNNSSSNIYQFKLHFFYSLQFLLLELLYYY